MAKADQKGRTKGEPHIRLHRGVTYSEAWKGLSCVARCVLLEVWVRHNGFNNGQIACSHRQIKKALRIGSAKATSAFRELQDAGFIIMRQRGSFDWKAGAGEGRATEWEITTEPCNGKPATGLYRQAKKKTTVRASGTAGTSTRGRSRHKPPSKQSNGTRRRNRYGQNDDQIGT